LDVVWFDECGGIFSDFSKVGTGETLDTMMKCVRLVESPPRVISALAANDAILGGEMVLSRPL